MTDSERLDRDEPTREPRFEAVVRWAEYIQDNPPEVWGPQQNAVVNAQFDSLSYFDGNSPEVQRLAALDDELETDDE
ncbi:MAG: hypothetical protein ABEH60_01820 [Halonotius sp.]